MQSSQTFEFKSGPVVVVGGGGGGGGAVVVGGGGGAVVDCEDGADELDTAAGVYVAKYASASNGVAKPDGTSEGTYGSEGVGGSSGGVFSGAGSGGTWASKVPSVLLTVGRRIPSGSYCGPV